jgi:hypothetical protein
LLTERQKLGTHNVEARRLEFNIVDLRDIKAIIDLMKKNSINEFELERQDFKIRLKRGATVAIPGVAIDDGSVGNAPHPMALPGSHPPPTGNQIADDRHILSVRHRPNPALTSRSARRSSRTPWSASSRR